MINYNELISQLKLAAKDKQDFDELVNKLLEQDQQNIFELLNENPNMAKVIIDNYRKKKEIFTSQDKNAWKKLLQEEKQIINKFAEE